MKTFPKSSSGFRSVISEQSWSGMSIPTRFTKFFGRDAPDGLSLSEKVLSNPEYCRETVERLMQLELELNGVEGNGYNEGYQKPTKDEKKEWLHNIVKHAIFGGKAEQYQHDFQRFLDTGKMPTSVPIHFRRKSKALGIDSLHTKIAE